MTDSETIESLRARVAGLEEENEAIRERGRLLKDDVHNAIELNASISKQMKELEALMVSQASQVSLETDRVKQLEDALARMSRVVDALMPGAGYIAIQDYAELNDAPIEARRLLEGKIYTSAPTIPQGEPVAWMGYSPRDGRVEFSIDKPAPSVMRDFNMRPLYTSVPTIPEGYLLAEKACREFIRKVENGEARSTRSYAAMKMAIDLIDAIGWSTKKKWGE